jgi:hypothetical protein
MEANDGDAALPLDAAPAGHGQSYSFPFELIRETPLFVPAHSHLLYLSWGMALHFCRASPDPNEPKLVDHLGRIKPAFVFEEYDRGPARPASWINRPAPEPGPADES